MSNMSKKKIIAMMALVIVIAIMGTGTLAYFTTRVVTHNVITSGGVNIQLVEEFPAGGDDQHAEGVMPGSELEKKVQVQNLDEPAWIRVKVTVSCNGKAVDPKVMAIDYNVGTAANQWTKGEDNIYYYNSIVSAPDKTAPLFSKVAFSGKDMGNEYQNSEFVVSVEAQAVQAQNNAPTVENDVTTVQGWPNS